MFKKNKKQEPEKIIADTNFTVWQDDLGFLNLIMTRKKNITKNFYIEIFDKQLSNTDYITDEDIEDIIEETVKEVMTDLSPKYKQYLADKYFGSEMNLLKFVTEDLYVDFTSSAVIKNRDKVIKKTQQDRIKAIMAQNKKEDEGDE